jgi:hypothetical protein
MNREALRKLADHLETKVSQQQFDMAEYRNDCGTVGCALAHATDCVAPMPNIPVGRTPTCYDWEHYADDQFGTRPWQYEWLWCFGPDWAAVDNTPSGAARRIRHLLDFGLPDNWERQAAGLDPLSY